MASISLFSWTERLVCLLQGIGYQVLMSAWINSNYGAGINKFCIINIIIITTNYNLLWFNLLHDKTMI